MPSSGQIAATIKSLFMSLRRYNFLYAYICPSLVQLYCTYTYFGKKMFMEAILYLIQYSLKLINLCLLLYLWLSWTYFFFKNFVFNRVSNPVKQYRVSLKARFVRDIYHNNLGAVSWVINCPLSVNGLGPSSSYPNQN